VFSCSCETHSSGLVRSARDTGFLSDLGDAGLFVAQSNCTGVYMNSLASYFHMQAHRHGYQRLPINFDKRAELHAATSANEKIS
jgi:hypothetical protein